MIAALYAVAVAALAIVMPPAPSPGSPRPMHATYGLMPLGDSITQGVGSTDGTGWRGPLQQLLGGGGVQVGSQGTAPLRHDGHSGWTCDQLAAQARAWVTTYRPRVVLLDCGTNDAGRDHNLSGQQILDSMRTLLGEIRAGAPSALIIVAQPTITPLNTAAQQQALNDFDNLLPSLGVPLVDMRGVEISADQVHPDDAGYQDMARRWLAGLRQAGVV